MQNLIKTVTQQISVVCYCKQRSLVCANQAAETVQIRKIQKDIRLVQNQKIRRQKHFSHNLQQFVFTSADFRKFCICKVFHTCKMKLPADRAFIVVAVHSLVEIQKFLIPCKYRIHFRRRSFCHFLTDCGNPLLHRKKPFAEILKYRNVLQLVPDTELTCISDSAAFIADNFSVKEICFRMHDHICQGGFSGAVTADQRTVTARLQCK